MQKKALHLIVNSLNTLIKLANPAHLGENTGNAGIARVSGIAHVVQRNDIGKLAWAPDFHPVIKDGDTNMVPSNSVIAMGDRVDKTFEPGELWVFGNPL